METLLPRIEEFGEKMWLIIMQLSNHGRVFIIVISAGCFDGDFYSHCLLPTGTRNSW